MAKLKKKKRKKLEAKLLKKIHAGNHLNVSKLLRKLDRVLDEDEETLFFQNMFMTGNPATHNVSISMRGRMLDKNELEALLQGQTENSEMVDNDERGYGRYTFYGQQKQEYARFKTQL